MRAPEGAASTALLVLVRLPPPGVRATWTSTPPRSSPACVTRPGWPSTAAVQRACVVIRGWSRAEPGGRDAAVRDRWLPRRGTRRALAPAAAAAAPRDSGRGVRATLRAGAAGDRHPGLAVGDDQLRRIRRVPRPAAHRGRDRTRALVPARHRAAADRLGGDLAVRWSPRDGAGHAGGGGDDRRRRPIAVSYFLKATIAIPVLTALLVLCMRRPRRDCGSSRPGCCSRCSRRSSTPSAARAGSIRACCSPTATGTDFLPNLSSRFFHFESLMITTRHGGAGHLDLALFRRLWRGDRVAHNVGRGGQLRRIHRARPDHADGTHPEHRQCVLRHLFPEIHRHDLRGALGPRLLFRGRAFLCRGRGHEIDCHRADHSCTRISL